MKNKFKHIESRGLPGGPNEMFTYVTGVFSTEGYKANSPDVNNPFNIIPSSNITMEGVDFPVRGYGNNGIVQDMKPGGNYNYGDADYVFEVPMAQDGTEIPDEAAVADDSFLYDLEKLVNKSLGDINKKAKDFSENPEELNSIDNMRHASGGRYAAEAIQQKVRDIPYVGGLLDFVGVDKAAGFVGANAMGIGHELRTIFGGDERPFLAKLQEMGEDTFNNYVGSIVGSLGIDDSKKDEVIRYLSYNNLLPDGYVRTEQGKKDGLSEDIYFKDEDGKRKTAYQRGGGLLDKTMKCNSCGWKWKAADGGNDVSTCHKCGGEALPTAQNGREQATISAYEEPAWYEKAVDYLASPFTAFGYSATNQDLPDSIPINAENRNVFDGVIDMINPFAWAKYAASAKRNLDQGEYLDAGFDALGAIPVVPAWLAQGKNATKAGKNVIKNAAKYTDEVATVSDDIAKATVSDVKPSWSRGVTHYGRSPEGIQDALKAMKLQGKHLDEIGFNVDDVIAANVINHGNKSGRQIAEVALPNGQSQLFYKSSGLAGKKGIGKGGTTEGLWQPYGGHASIGATDNWFIKDAGYENFYGSNSFKAIANKLDEIESGWDMSKQVLKSKLKYGGDISELDKAQSGKEVRVDYGDGNIKKLSTDSAEYKKLYNEGSLGVNLLPEVTVTADKQTGKNILEDYPYYNQLTEEEKKYFRDSGPIGRQIRSKATDGVGVTADGVKDFAMAWLRDLPLASLQTPQSALVEGVEGLRGNESNMLNALIPDQQRVPSDVWGFETTNDMSWYNPRVVGNFAMDMAADPTNLVGAGVADDLLKLGLKQGLKNRAVRASDDIVKGVNFIQNDLYKYNPWAYNNIDSKLPEWLQLSGENEKWLRQVGKPAIKDAQVTRTVRELGEEISPKLFAEKLAQLQNSNSTFSLGKRYPGPFFKKGEIFFDYNKKSRPGLDGRRNTRGRSGSADYLIEFDPSDPIKYQGMDSYFQPAYLKTMSLDSRLFNKQIGDVAIMKPKMRDVENFNFYKKDPFWAYKKAPLDKLQEGGQAPFDKESWEYYRQQNPEAVMNPPVNDSVVIPPKDGFTKQEFIENLAKPKPEFEKPKTLNFNNILDYVVETRGGNRDLWGKAADTIAFHESGPWARMDVGAKQYLGGPGRGLFQFEGPSLKTAQKRYTNIAKSSGFTPNPDILNAKSADELNAQDQYTLFFANLIESKAKLSDYAEGKMKLEDLWLTGHKNVEKQGDRESFLESLKAAEKEGIKNGYTTFKKGGEFTLYDIYKKYVMGGATDEVSKDIYDKLNRVHYKDAKGVGMSVPNYILTYVMKGS
jgi:hypothetical protein